VDNLRFNAEQLIVSSLEIRNALKAFIVIWSILYTKVVGLQVGCDDGFDDGCDDGCDDGWDG
jgi:hypothetical protein